MRILNLSFDNREKDIMVKNSLTLTDRDLIILFKPIIFYGRNNELKKRTLDWLTDTLYKTEEEVLKYMQEGKLP